jgi:dTDP-4-amino-4,6-dideoxygalactose transaminase
MIPVFKPLIEDEEFEAARAALEMGWLGMGSYVNEFEQGVQKYLGASDRYFAAVSTGHAALHLGLIIAGVGPGDEVITPSFNNIADFQAILAVGATPVFCDINEDTLCIDLDRVEELITPRTKALIVMDYDCVVCDHDRVAEIAERHNLRVIHDAAHAFGSKYKGKMIGSFSDICMFSFDPVKTVTCIDGGMLIVRTEEELKKIQEMRLVGMGQPASVMYQNKRAWTYDVNYLGFRYHMANLHAAIGLSQLAKMDEISDTRRSACRYYNEQLSLIEEVTVPKTDFAEVTPFLYYIRVPSSSREELKAHLLENGVDVGIHWQPGHWMSLFKDCRRDDLGVTDRIANEILSLPLHSKMSREDQDKIIGEIGNFFAGAERGIAKGIEG